jgi:hypothetical protein
MDKVVVKAYEDAECHYLPASYMAGHMLLSCGILAATEHVYDG